MRDDVSQMKWWGWADENIEFDASDKPALLPFIARVLGLKEDDEQVVKPVSIDEVELPEQVRERRQQSAVPLQEALAVDLRS